MKPLTAYFPKKPKFSEPSCSSHASKSIPLPPQDDGHPQSLVHLERDIDKALEDRHVCLKALISCIKWCVKQGLPLDDHDEWCGLDSKGNFLTLLDFVADSDPKIYEVVRENAYDNHTFSFHQIQKDILNAYAYLTTKAIVDEIVRDNQPFSLIVDESRDVSVMKNWLLVLRYVNNEGSILEHFVGIVHVRSTTALSLKASIETFFLQYGLSMSNLRGQSYDGVTNMQEQFNDLKSLVLRENPSAYYVHRFAHEFQLVLVKLVRSHTALGLLFECLSMLPNTLDVSCLRSDLFHKDHYENLLKEIAAMEQKMGDGLNQENTVKQTGDTRWGSYLDTIFSVIKLCV